MREEDYFSLGDAFLAATDIAVSVRDSWHAVLGFWLALCAEFYSQLTTISWLSVSQEAAGRPAGRQEAAPWGLAGLAESLLAALPLPSGPSEPEEVAGRGAVGRAEEWVRLAEEAARNNSRARARLLLTKVARRAATAGQEEGSGEEEQEEGGEWGLSSLLSWPPGAAEEAADGAETPGGPLAGPEEGLPGEEHLELFYLASFLLLMFMVSHIIRSHLSLSRRKAALLSSLSRC